MSVVYIWNEYIHLVSQLP